MVSKRNKFRIRVGDDTVDKLDQIELRIKYESGSVYWRRHN